MRNVITDKYFHFVYRTSFQVQLELVRPAAWWECDKNNAKDGTNGIILPVHSVYVFRNFGFLSLLQSFGIVLFFTFYSQPVLSICSLRCVLIFKFHSKQRNANLTVSMCFLLTLVDFLFYFSFFSFRERRKKNWIEKPPSIFRHRQKPMKKKTSKILNIMTTDLD